MERKIEFVFAMIIIVYVIIIAIGSIRSTEKENPIASYEDYVGR